MICLCNNVTVLISVFQSNFPDEGTTTYNGGSSYTNNLNYASKREKFYGCGGDSLFWSDLDLTSSFRLKLTFNYLGRGSKTYKNVVWESCATNTGFSFKDLVVRDNGELCMLDKDGKVMWTTGSTNASTGKPARAPTGNWGPGKCPPI